MPPPQVLHPPWCQPTFVAVENNEVSNAGAEAESIAEDVVPDARAVGCWLERVLRSLLRHWRSYALRACKVGSKAIGYGFGRKPRTNSAKLFCWTALEKNGSRATEKKTLGSCSVVKHFIPIACYSSSVWIE